MLFCAKRPLALTNCNGLKLFGETKRMEKTWVWWTTITSSRAKTPKKKTENVIICEWVLWHWEKDMQNKRTEKGLFACDRDFIEWLTLILIWYFFFGVYVKLPFVWVQSFLQISSAHSLINKSCMPFGMGSKRSLFVSKPQLQIK